MVPVPVSSSRSRTVCVLDVPGSLSNDSTQPGSLPLIVEEGGTVQVACDTASGYESSEGSGINAVWRGCNPDGTAQGNL